MSRRAGEALQRSRAAGDARRERKKEARARPRNSRALSPRQRAEESLKEEPAMWPPIESHAVVLVAVNDGAVVTFPLTNVPALSSLRTVGQHLCRVLIIKLRRVPLNSRSQWPRAPTLGSMMSTSKRTKDRQEKHCS